MPYIGIFCLLICMQNAFALPEKKIYRYTDNNGNTIIDNKVPPHIIPKGYEILSKRGNVIKLIKPAKTKAEILAEEKAAAEAEAARIISEKEKKKSLNNEYVLMNTFSSIEEISQFHDGKIKALDTHMGVAYGYMEQLKKHRDTIEKQASNLERAGAVVPEQFHNSLSEIHVQIYEHQKFIREREKEKADIKQQSDRDVALFQKVKAQNKPKN